MQVLYIMILRKNLKFEKLFNSFMGVLHMTNDLDEVMNHTNNLNENGLVIFDNAHF